MKPFSPITDPGVARAKPLLGTTVSVRVHGLAPARAHAAIDAAFAVVARAHGRMSFHEDTSDVARLNREAHIAPVRVDPMTYAVIARAAAISAASDGAFDISIAPALVERGLLPRPAGAPQPHSGAAWKDIELLTGCRIAFRRPLWIDIGGIAKGYAVDLAIEAALAFCPAQVCVNAGGDLRIAGPASEKVQLDAEIADTETVPVMEVLNGSLASSCGTIAGRGSHFGGPHVCMDANRPTRPKQFVSVAAPSCMDADALTKVVMARGACSARVLGAFDALAVVHDAQFGWREIRGHA